MGEEMTPARATKRGATESRGLRASALSGSRDGPWRLEEPKEPPPQPDTDVPDADEQARPSGSPEGGRPSTEGDAGEAARIPEVLPILPLRKVVVFPLSFLPLSVGQARSVKLIEDAAVGDRVIGLVAMRDPEIEEPGPDEIYEVGTAAQIHRMVKGSDGNIGIFVQGLERFRIKEWADTEPYLKAQVEVMPDSADASLELEALRRNVVELFTRLVNIVPHLPEELADAIESLEDARALAYFIAANTKMELPEAQKLLEMDSAAARLRALIAHLGRELEVLELGRKIQQEARGEMEKMQREFFLRQQLKAIKKELGEADEGEAELEQIEERIEQAGMPDEAKTEALRELGRLRNLPPAAAEYGVIRTYLDWMVSLPWSKTTEDNLEIEHARTVLDEDHHDLEDIKARILEFLAVQKLRRERAEAADVPLETSGGILAFGGPPGTGKTSLGRSIARSLGREYVRMSLGGLRDEAEIRGHRRTYIGAMPGRIVQALKRAGTRNPVFILDEIDKVGASFRGDPESALLEVLDPEQNVEFRDLYLDVPFDLSDVLFIATANDLTRISGPLRDRLEIIELSGYTERDKRSIASGFLLPRQRREAGLTDEELQLDDDALRRIIRHYTREAGVRDLERQIGKIARKVAVEVAKGGDEEVEVITADDVPEYLGAERFTHEAAERTSLCGVATGLAYTPYGGDVLFVEASSAPGEGKFVITGQLGDVMRESAQAALAYVRAHGEEIGIPRDYFRSHDLHVHVPAGATPKDGPSAGVTIATAIVSLLTRRLVRSDIGMTGEITLRGKVLPVGGIKEKVLAAHRSGLVQVILPKRNVPDLDDVPEEVRGEMEFHFVDHVDEVWQLALEASPSGNGAAGDGDLMESEVSSADRASGSGREPA